MRSAWCSTGYRSGEFAGQKMESKPQDEAHFWLNGYVNEQNCRIWSEANPQVYVETPLHPEKLTVWCALWAGGIIGPYFFKNDEGHNVTVKELWFQQDGATCHTACATIDLLKDTFSESLISRFGPVNWRPRSCDLTPLDYFLWGYVKSLVYANKPQTFDLLEGYIRCVIADIRPQMLEKVIENWTSRLDYIRASRGSHMPKIIFKITGHPRVTTPNEDLYFAVTAKRNRRNTASDISPQLCSATGTTVSRQTVHRRLVHIGVYARSPRTDLHVQTVTMSGHIYRDVILEHHVRLFRDAIDAEFMFMDDNGRPHRTNIVDE
ncbi:DUF4817 domain-containing protein [Trichonephila clavipes]|nr:DUF4817 domain-containing protein [Trichonephila clavipes]